MTAAAPGCEVCGRSPASVITLRRQVGMVLFQKRYKFKGPLCRDHAIEHAREWLRLTTLQGWWGVVSFFMNFPAVATNLLALRRARGMPPPATQSS